MKNIVTRDDFKNTELGPIPKDWNNSTFGKALTGFSSGSTPSRQNKEYFNGDVLWITSGELNYNVVTETNEKITEEAVKKTNLKILEPGTFLIAITGLEAAGTRGSCAIVGKRATTNQSCMALYPKKDINLDYLFQFYVHYGEKLAFRYCQGTKQQSYNGETARILPFNYPEIKEQKAIAHVLCLMDKIINAKNRLIIQKELRKKWLMQNLLSGNKRLKGFTGKWKEYSYDGLLKVVERPIEWNDNELYKLVSVRRRSGGIFFREALYGHQIKVKNLRNANEGDFLFSKMQIVHGASSLVTKEFAGSKISGSYIAVIAKDPKTLSMEFFNWYSKTPYFYHQTYISSYGVHIEKMTFDFESFLSLGMKLPSFEEQTAIARVLNLANKEIQLLKIKTDKLKEQKKGMMQLLLTGKKRVKLI